MLTEILDSRPRLNLGDYRCQGFKQTSQHRGLAEVLDQTVGKAHPTPENLFFSSPHQDLFVAEKPAAAFQLEFELPLVG